LPAVVVAVSPPHSAGAAYTRGGNVRTNAALTLLKRISNFVNVSLDLIALDGATMSVVMGTMLRGDRNLEKGEKREQHGYHALGLAEVGHDAGSRIYLWCVTTGRAQVKKNDSAQMIDKERDVLKSVTTLEKSKRSIKKKGPSIRNLDVKDYEESKIWRRKQGRTVDGVIYRGSRMLRPWETRIGADLIMHTVPIKTRGGGDRSVWRVVFVAMSALYGGDWMSGCRGGELRAPVGRGITGAFVLGRDSPDLTMFGLR
jgi:hypothetical protein